MLEHITGGQLAQRGGFAGTGGANQGDYAAGINGFFAQHRNAMGQMRQQHAPSLAHISHVRNLTQQTLTDIRRQAHLRQTTPEASLLGFLLIQLPPGQTTQLGLQHLAQPGQLGAHGAEPCAVGFSSRRRGSSLRTTRRCLRSGSRLSRLLNQSIQQLARLGRALTGGVTGAVTKQLAVDQRLIVRGHLAVFQLSAGSDNALLGLFQFLIQARRRRAQARRFVIQGCCQFDAASHPAVGNDGRIGAQLIADQLHRLAHIGGKETFDFHG